MKTCRVQPDEGTCLACMDLDDLFGQVSDCGTCSLKTKEYELLGIGTNFWTGDYAMVQADGKIQKVPLDRIYDVYDVKEEK